MLKETINTNTSEWEMCMCCDECKYYNWYYDYCRKWGCRIDERAVCNCYEKMDTPVSDAMKEATGLKQVTEVI